jgi:hypothetical protein
MFASVERVLCIGIDAARERLANLAQDGFLSEASNAAYLSGMGHLRRASQPGELAGTSHLERVQVLEPLYGPGVMDIVIRWEAIDATGALFPVLDADITLSAENGRCARLALTGCYRSVSGRPGACADNSILRNVAGITLQSAVTSLAASLERAEADPVPAVPANPP